jgi:hypothetical protein
VPANAVHAASSVQVAAQAPASEQTGAAGVHPSDPRHCWHSWLAGLQYGVTLPQSWDVVQVPPWLGSTHEKWSASHTSGAGQATGADAPWSWQSCTQQKSELSTL